MSLQSLPHDFAALSVVVLLLGVRHGLDADHLAAIDGLTRANSRHQPRLSRMTGALFSAGHGFVVMAVAMGVSLMAATWVVPAWLEVTSAWTSIVVLSLLALINLHNLTNTPSHQLTHPKGLRSVLFDRLLVAQRPGSMVAVGALFALSFDTISQAMLFAVTASQFGGWQAALAMAALFTLGMLLIDGINGLWIARLIRQADARAQLTSRIMTIAVSCVSLLTAAFGVVLQLKPSWVYLLNEDMWWLSLVIVLMLLLSYFGGNHLSLHRSRLEHDTYSHPRAID